MNSPKPHLHLFMPELFAPLAAWQLDFAFEPESTILLKILAQTQLHRLTVAGLERTLLQASGYNADTLPWAGWRFHQQTGQAPSRPVLCADPVCMVSGLNCVTLSPQRPALSATEAHALITSLNRHLALDGWQLLAPHPEQWYLQAMEGHTTPSPFPVTTPLSEIGNRNIFPYLPHTRQPQDKYWQRLHNELQMLLHQHPVNRQREQAGQLTVNGLWFWGEGEALPSPAPLHHPAIIMGGGITGQVVAHQTGARWQAAYTAGDEPVRFLILDQLVAPALAEDPHGWQQALQQQEATLLSEVMQNLRNGGIQLSLYDCAGQQLEYSPQPAWQFWKKRRSRWSDFL